MKRTPQINSRFRFQFKNEQGAIDLASVMVGIIVIGIIGGLIAATVFVLIPWVQDNAAKQQLDSINASENAYMGLSSSGTYALPAGAIPNSYGKSADLEANNLLKAGVSYCVTTVADGKSYIAFSQSLTGTIWTTSDQNTKPVKFTGVVPTECDFIREYSSAPYVDPTPKLTSLTYQCDVTTTGRMHLQGTLRGTETWSDGLPVRTYTGTSLATTRTFDAGVTYTVKFEGTYTKIAHSSVTAFRSCLRSVNHWGSETGVIDAEKAFDSHSNLTDVPKHIPSTITNMREMFRNADAFNDPDISDWDVSNVNNMYLMFYNTAVFNQPLDSWDTGNVTNMSWTFYDAISFNQPLDSWDTKNVTNMSYMFKNTPFNQPLNSWDTGQVTSMSNMFEGASAFNQPLNSWNTGQVTSMSSMFAGALSFNQPIGSWNTGNVTNMTNMFTSYDPSAFNQPLNSWNTSKVTNMMYMFFGASSFNQPLSNWDTTNVTNMSHMFYGAAKFNQNINSWNTSKVTTMESTFANTYDFNQPLHSWDTSQVITMTSMFYNSSDFNQSLNDWNVSNVTEMRNMFTATSFNQPLNKWNTAKVINMSGMFSFTPGFSQDLSGWDTTALTNGTKFAHYSFPTAYLPPKTSL